MDAWNRAGTELLRQYQQAEGNRPQAPQASLWFYFLVAPKRAACKSAAVWLLMTWQSPSAPSSFCPLFRLLSPPFSATTGSPRLEGRNLHAQLPETQPPPATCTVPRKLFDGSNAWGHCDTLRPQAVQVRSSRRIWDLEWPERKRLPTNTALPPDQPLKGTQSLSLQSQRPGPGGVAAVRAGIQT